MGYRIRSINELTERQSGNQINPKIAERIERELKEIKQESASSPLKRTKKPKRPANEAELLGLPFSPVPPENPADILYQAMVRRWGRYYSGGEVVWELKPFSDNGYRLDAALPSWRIGCELDGWQFHAKFVESFKKTREKQFMFCRRGWLLFQLSAEQVRESLDDVLDGIAEAMEHQTYRKDYRLQQYPKGWSKMVK